MVEAARQSGSLITARMASDMGREVFAIPGSIHSPLSRGCHALIRQGAKLVESAQDISDELGVPVASVTDTQTGTGTVPEATATTLATATSQQILAALGHDPVSTDTLQQRTGLDIGILQAQLLQLELNQQISQLPDGRYQARP